jgi:hypothetical protein
LIGPKNPCHFASVWMMISYILRSNAEFDSKFKPSIVAKFQGCPSYG